MAETIISTEFLEKYPLYRKLQGNFPDDVRQVKWPAVHLICGICRDRTTFVGIIALDKKQLYPPKQYTTESNYLLAGTSSSLSYLCASCSDYFQFYQILFAEDLSFVMKTGQYPAWDISTEETLSKTLGVHEANYRKGKVCESQGYGIGAYAYYRRIIEDIIYDLLIQIQKVVSSQGNDRFREALSQVRADHIATEKIALVKDLLPGKLRPKDINPLDVLYHALSNGMHSETDEECLQFASDIRESLIYLVEQMALVQRAEESDQEFTDSMKRLLEKRANRPN